MPDVDKALATELNAAKKKPRNFAFSPGSDGGAMTISKRPIPKGKLKELRNEAGATKVYSGRCFWDKDAAAFVFETTGNPPGDLARRLKAALQEKAGRTVKLEVRPVEEVEEVDDTAADEEVAGSEADTDTATGSGPVVEAVADVAPPSALFKEKVKATKAALDRLKGVDPGLAEPLVTRFAAALGLAQAGRFGEATAALDDIDAQARDAGPGTAEIAAKAYQDRVAGLAASLKDALKAGGDRAQDVKRLFAESQAFGKAQDYAQANARLDEVERSLAPPVDAPKADWETRLAAVEPRYLAALRDRPEPQAAPLRGVMDFATARAAEGDYARAVAALQRLDASLATAGPGESERETESETETDGAPVTSKAFTERLKGLLPRIKEAQGAGGGRADEVRLRTSEAQVFARQGAFGQAVEALDALESLLDGGGETGDGESRPTDALAIWVRARDRVKGQIETLQGVLMGVAGSSGNKNFETIARDGLAAITRRFQVGLHVALLEFDQAPPAKKDAARKKALAVLDAFRDLLDSEPMIPLAEDNPWNVAVDIRSALGAAFDRIEREVSV